MTFEYINTIESTIDAGYFYAPYIPIPLDTSEILAYTAFDTFLRKAIEATRFLYWLMIG